ncbi:MAG TPA: hypothetical protein VNP92_21005 [Actinophytocola sp.]|nr:hypothetical protein [Actinophytocola sp.]
MDHHELTTALHEATEDLVPRTDFTTAVLKGGRRRRIRGRIAIGAALAGTAAVAVAAAIVVPNQLAAPPPADRTDQPKNEALLTESGGNLIDDKEFVQDAVDKWNSSDVTAPGNRLHLEARIDEPHIYWAGDTQAGPAALVAQRVRLSTDDEVLPEERGQEMIAVALLATDLWNAARHGLHLAAIQLDGDHDGPGGYFMFFDNQTVIGIQPEEGLSLFASPNTTIHDDGRSRRKWTQLVPHDGVALAHFPESAHPSNVRLVVSESGREPNQGKQKMGAHLPLLPMAHLQYPSLLTTPDNGLGWPPGDLRTGRAYDLPRSPINLFDIGLRESGLIDPASYEPIAAQWLVVAGLGDERVAIIGTYQEMDNPAYLFQVLVRPDGTVLEVKRGAPVVPSATLPIAVRMSNGAGWVVAARGEQLSHRTGSGAWSPPLPDAGLAPDGATQVRVGDQVVNLPK